MRSTRIVRSSPTGGSYTIALRLSYRTRKDADAVAALLDALKERIALSGRTLSEEVRLALSERVVALSRRRDQ